MIFLQAGGTGLGIAAWVYFLLQVDDPLYFLPLLVFGIVTIVVAIMMISWEKAKSHFFVVAFFDLLGLWSLFSFAFSLAAVQAAAKMEDGKAKTTLEELFDRLAVTITQPDKVVYPLTVCLICALVERWHKKP